MVNSHFINVLLGKQSFYKVFSNDPFDRLNFRIFAWLGLNPDYAPAWYDGMRIYKEKQSTRIWWYESRWEKNNLNQDMLVCLKKENVFCLVIWIQASVSWFSNSKIFSLRESGVLYIYLLNFDTQYHIFPLTEPAKYIHTKKTRKKETNHMKNFGQAATASKL